MKIVKQSATLIALTFPVDPEGIAVMGGPESIIERAGRVCYKSEDKITHDSYKAFIEKVCQGLGHESIEEHPVATFHCVMDRGISHEAVRHRIDSIDDELEDAYHPSPGSYSQESTRYCNYGNEKHGSEITVVQPTGFVGEDYQDWAEAMVFAEAKYLAMIRRGVSSQMARSVLPTCLKTELIWTANFREWKHILKLRTSPKAHPQMQELAGMIRDVLKKVAPTVFRLS